MDLKKARHEYAKRPIEGVSPAELEKRFPKVDLFEETPTCVVPDCNRPSFKGLKNCKLHHLEWVAAREAEVERLGEEWVRRRNKKDFPEIEAQNLVRNLPFCANCGTGVPFSDRIVRLKPAARRPKKPSHRSVLYEMLCEGCAGK